jgi:hypothetical protein
LTFSAATISGFRESPMSRFRESRSKDSHANRSLSLYPVLSGFPQVAVLC